MGCLKCGQKRLPGASRLKPLVIGDANGYTHYVVLQEPTDWGFQVGQRVYLTGDGVQALIDDGTVTPV